MSDGCTVVIGSAALLEDLRRHIQDEGDILTFTDRETLIALEVISARRPRAVTLERLFAATSRGAALINRVKADPLLSQTEIRVVSHDGTYSRVSPRRVAAAPKPVRVGEPQAAEVDVAAPPIPAPVDFPGTRRAPRFESPKEPRAVDGSAATLVDLKMARRSSRSPLKPQHRGGSCSPTRWRS